MPALPPGGLLLRVLYLSLDPYMRGRMDDRKSYAKPVGIGEVMDGRERVRGGQVRSFQGYAAGDIVLAHTGWRTHAAWDGAAPRKLDPQSCADHDRAGRARHAGLYGLFGPSAHRQAQAGRDGGRCGGERTGRLAGRTARQDGRRPGGRHRRRRGQVPLRRRTNCASTRPSTIGRRTSRHSSRRHARRASMSTSRMSAARSGRPCCLCSIRSRGCRSAG